MKLPKINPNQPIAIDLETCDPELKCTAPGYISNVGFVAGIAVCAEEGAWYIPIGHTKGDNYDKQEVADWLNEICSADTEKIFHNAQYDVGWLYAMGVQLHGSIFDTMLAAPLLNENRYSYTLDSLGKEYCGEGKFEEALRMAVADEFNQVRTRKAIIRLKEDVNIKRYAPFVNAKKRESQFYELWPKEVQDRYDVLGYKTSKNGQEKFLVPTKRQADVKALLWAVDPEDMGTYPIQDVVLTYQLYKIFKKELANEKLTKLMALESEVIPTLMEMRMKGVRIDMEKAVKLDRKYDRKLKELQKKLNEICGFSVDINTDDSLIAICKKFNLEYVLTAKGNPCFSSEKVPKDPYGIFAMVLEMRTYLKARDTYIRGYIFGSTLNGWLHGQYNQLKSDEGGTVTGRLSSSCIAEGTPVALPGGYKNIEDIEPGDQVYCYRDDGTVTISEVLNKFDKGIKPCIELRWQSSGNGQTGSLVCTPDHLIKTKHKGWVPAGKLKRYDKMYHLKRALQANGRYRLYGADCYMETEEQCIKREYFKADSKRHIHHIDLNKENNSLDNLQILTHEEHCRLHGYLREPRNEYIQLTEEAVLKALHENNGSIVKARKALGVGYINFRRFCEQHDISYNHTVSSVRPVGDRHVWDIEVRDHHNFIAGEICVHNCPNMQNLPNPKSEMGRDIRGLFLPDTDEEKWLSMDYSGQEPKMLVHTVIAVEKKYGCIAIGQKHHVPGVEIAMQDRFRGRSADFHSAVAYICVEEEKKLEGIVLADEPEEQQNREVKAFRPKAKSIGLGVMYGSGNKKVAEEMTKKGFPMTTEDAANIRENIYKGVPFLDFINRQLMTKARTRGYIKTILGRRGRFDLWEVPVYDNEEKKLIGSKNFGFKTRQEAYKWKDENKENYESLGTPTRAMTYKALNKYIQGSSADQTKTAMVHLYKKGDLSLNVLDIFYRRIKDYEPPKFKTQVHDEVNLSIKPNENVQQYQYIMEHCIPLEVEVVADPVICDNWAEAKG